MILIGTSPATVLDLAREELAHVAFTEPRRTDHAWGFVTGVVSEFDHPGLQALRQWACALIAQQPGQPGADCVKAGTGGQLHLQRFVPGGWLGRHDDAGPPWTRFTLTIESDGPWELDLPDGAHPMSPGELWCWDQTQQHAVNYYGCTPRTAMVFSTAKALWRASRGAAAS